MGLLWLLSFLHSSLFGNEVLEELRMSGSTSSYDHLVKQVEALRKENSHLRRELEDNSCHLSKLETETLDMKEMLKQLQTKLEQEACNLASTGRIEILDQLKELNTDVAKLCDIKWQSNMVCSGLDQHALEPPTERKQTHPGGIALEQDSLSVASGSVEHLEELNEERALLLSEIEKEEKEKAFYCTQIQNLGRQADELSQIKTVSKHMDLIRQQLQYEAHQIKAIIEERYGTSEDVTERVQMRMNRIQQIEKEILQFQQKAHQKETECCGKSNDQGTESTMNNLPQGLNNLGSKVEMVFWLLSMLATRDKEDMSRTLLAMSSSQDSCVAMRKSGCLPLLIQLLHDSERDSGPSRNSSNSKEARARASAALHNIIYSQPDEGQAKREMRVLHVLEQVRLYCETCWEWLDTNRQNNGVESNNLPLPIEPQICQAMCAIMKLSFDEEYRRAMNELGGLQAVAELLQVDCDMYGPTNDPLNSALRRYAGMALTNLTFGDVVNKATLCSRKGCMQSIVAQLESESEDIHQVVASILRNLSWRADVNSKRILREVRSVSALMQCALKAKKESTLKSLLSALWNLSAHSTENKVAICSVEGALVFLVGTLTYKCQSNSLAIIESGGGILRNVSSLIATNEEYRQILRDYNCLQTLLQHLKSHSLTIVSNACGTLWNLSARSSKDQELLWDLGAISMLRNLIHSKHKMIAMGSAAALRNLLTNRPAKYKDTSMVSPGSCMPSLYMRKQKALEAELDAKHLTETFDGIEKLSPKHPNINKPLRHIENLAKDYASDSGCFDDDEGPNISTGLETGGLSVLSMYLNSSFLQGQGMSRCRSSGRCSESDKDLDGNLQKFNPATDNVSVAAERLVNQISTTVARIDKIVEDMSNMHTSSEDSFSLSSEDQCIDWQCALDDLNETRTKSSSPCNLTDVATSGKREYHSKVHTLLGARTDYTNLSSDSLDGVNNTAECDTNPVKESSVTDQKGEHPMYQKRPTNLDLKSGEKNQLDGKDSDGQLSSRESKPTLNEAWGIRKPDEISKKRFSPFYEKIHVTSVTTGSSQSPSPGHSLTPQSLSGRKQAWVHSGYSQSSRNVNQGPSSTSTSTPISNDQETLQTYCVEDTPICFSRCSSLSSLSSAENISDVQIGSENEVDSDSSLEIIGVEKESPLPVEKTITDESFSSEEIRIKSSDHSFSSASQPIEIPCPKHEKFLIRKKLPSRNMDSSPSSPSENYLQETPLVLSRCSSVSSLGSFESPSIVSSIQSDPCSEMISGTISPSDLPDSPGQTMPPSRSKTPLLDQLEKDASQGNNHWDGDMKKHMDINDFKERFHLPPDIDTMLYFTLEKPNENFSCASSLSALTLHEPYIQKDIELKLMPLLQEKSCFNCRAQGEDIREERNGDGMEKVDKLDSILENSDDDIEILKECINSAMPTKFRKVKTSAISGLPTQVLQSKKPLQLPIYMLLPAHSQVETSGHSTSKNDTFKEDSSYSDSVDGTPVNFSSSASLSDETLEYPQKESPKLINNKAEVIERRELLPAEGQNADDLEVPIAVRMHDRSLEQGNKYNLNVNNSKLGAQSHSLNLNQREVLKRNQNSLPPQSYQGQNSHVFQPGGIAKSLRKDQTTSRHVLELDTKKSNCKRSEEGQQRMDVPCAEYIHGSYAFQSMRHTTPTEEAVYCFYENDSLDMLTVAKDTVKPKTEVKNDYEEKIINQNGAVKVEPDQSHKAITKLRTASLASKTERNITNESPLCFSLSSSLSSLSDIELEDTQVKTRKAFVKSRKKSQISTASKSFNNGCSSLSARRDSSPSSLSYDSEDDLLQKCISSAMPKKRKHSSKRKSERSAKQNMKGNVQNNTGRNMAYDVDHRKDASRDVYSSLSDLTSPDLESIEWKAIQEGANSIVTSLHQAAACLSREPSSESDSILSFVSGLSIGSTLHFTLERKDKKKTLKEQTRSVEGAEGASKEGRKLNENNKAAGSKVSVANKFSNAPKPPSRAVSLPVVFRGRTVIYMPDMWKKSAIASPASKKAAPKNTAASKNSNQTFRSRSLHRPGNMTEKVDSSLPKRSVTPPARMARGPSRNSTPSRQIPKNATPSVQSNRQGMPHATKPSINKLDQKSRPQAGSTPSTPNIKSPVSGKQSRKSPAQPPNIQTPTKQGTPAKKMPSFQRNESFGPNKSQGSKKVMPPNRLDLVRMSSTKSSGSESDKSSFVRQLTFIKESSSLLMRQKSEASSSESVSSLSQSVSPRRSKSDFQKAFIRSSQCQELRVGKTASNLNISQRKAMCNEDELRTEKLSRRPSSESPSRLPVKNSAAWKQDNFKRYSSSPHINVLQQAGSPSSIRSASSESSDKTKSEEEPRTKQQLANQKEQQMKKNQPSLKGTWRRIKDEDIPYFLSNSLPPSAMALVNKSESEQQLNKVGTVETKTSDAFVQTEDFPITKTNSSTSPTLDLIPHIAQAIPRNAMSRSFIGKNTETAYGVYSDNEQEPETIMQMRNNMTVSAETENYTNVPGHMHFNSSRHGSPSRAARVTPFNYIPSPKTIRSDSGSLQPPQIRAPIINEKTVGKVQS
ncbi:adenomatous polyposis coli protein 2 isoform X2 [Chiloscyllium plagiosum]|uniref:adenomatous polyposis coli protein 2 isoform X2 n=1 Tax=Chiloscyllium plagiosum TaxID=36176 RepID=UPI001CB884C8|nr:adenomatous polyposis coli protein 2 isoform X2 [Chiloscyllium plagiosum]